MGIKELQQQLADGKITKDEYLAKLGELLNGEQISQEEHDEAAKYEISGGNGGGNHSGGGDPMTQEQIEKMIQSATDKVRTEYSKDLKEKQKEIDDLKKEKMSDEEKAKYEREQWEQDRKKKEQELQEREVALHTVDRLKDKELPLEFRDILAGTDVEKTYERIDKFEKQWQKALKAAVDERFKENGDDPNQNRKGGGGSNIKNPWTKEHFNLTKQAQIMRDDPDEAKRMKAEAGY